MNVHIRQHRCGDQRTAWESYFSPPTMRVLGIKLGSSGLGSKYFCPLSELGSLACTFSIIILTISYKLCGWKQPTFIVNGLGFPPLSLCCQHHGVSQLGSYWKPQKLIYFWAPSNCRQNLWMWDRGSCDFLVVCHKRRTSYIAWSVPPSPSLLVYFRCCDKNHGEKATEMWRELSWLTVLDHSPSLWKEEAGACGCYSRGIHRQEQRMSKCTLTEQLPLSALPWARTLTRKWKPTFRVGLPTSMEIAKKIFHKHIRKSTLFRQCLIGTLFLVILHCGKLEKKRN